MDYRKLLLDKLVALDAIDEDHCPVVTLDDYFLGNTQEDSIAPNQCGDGRPSLSNIYRRFKAVESRADVQGVYVGLHESWGESLDDDTWPAAENIHVFSSADAETAEEWVTGLLSDGISAGELPYGKHKAAPEPAPGSHLYTVYWD